MTFPFQMLIQENDKLRGKQFELAKICYQLIMNAITTKVVIWFKTRPYERGYQESSISAALSERRSP